MKDLRAKIRLAISAGTSAEESNSEITDRVMQVIIDNGYTKLDGVIDGRD